MSLLRSRGLELGCVLSLGLHAALCSALGRSTPAGAVRRPPAVFEIAMAAPLPLPASPAPEPSPEPREIVRRAVAPVAAKPPPPAETAAVESTAPADLTGLTLTNDSGSASWSSAVGSGAALKGPIALGRELPRTSPREVPPATTVSPLIDAANLSERPRPPPLDGVLRRNYPADARRVGLAGSAAVIARIDADGVARAVRLVSESGTGFGSACRQSLSGSRWSAPRDRSGRAVATEVRYTCRFQVD